MAEEKKPEADKNAPKKAVLNVPATNTPVKTAATNFFIIIVLPNFIF